MAPCTPLPILHAYVDGVLPPEHAARIGAHLPSCADCRDRIRELQRVDTFLDRPDRHGPHAVDLGDLVAAARQGQAPRPAVEADEEPGPRRSRARAAAALAALLLVAAILSVTRFFGAGGDQVQAGEETRRVVRHEAFWVASDPDRDLDVAGWRRALSALPAGPNGARETEARVLRTLASARLPDQWLRAGRAAAALGITEARADLRQRLAREDLTPAELDHGVRSLAAFGGVAAERALLRLARRRELPRRLLAEALVATGSSRVADRVWRLLKDDCDDIAELYLLIHAIPGSGSTELLVGEFVAGETAAVLPRLILERADSRGYLRRSLSASDGPTRSRLLALLGQLGDAEAIPWLRRLLRDPATFPAAAGALGSLVRAEVDEALVVLVRELPLVESVAAWSADARSATFREVFRALPARAGTELGKRIHDEGSWRRRPEQRRALLGLGLTGDAATLPVLTHALSHRGLRQPAVVALALSGLPEAVPIVGPLADGRDRGLRRLAQEALVVLGGPEAARALLGALRRSGDRRHVLRLLGDEPKAWCVPVLAEALRYRDGWRTARRLLRGLATEGGPAEDTPEAWLRWQRNRASSRVRSASER